MGLAGPLRYRVVDEDSVLAVPHRRKVKCHHWFSRLDD